jgi:hypothetical protein
MEEQFPRTGKTEAGGTKVTFCRSFSCRTSALTNAAPINSRERLKKSVLEFYTSSQNRFSGRKNLSNTSETRLPSKWRNTRKTGPLVTTTHMFWPGQRRKAVFLLPFSQPNCDFLGSDSNEKAPGGRGLPDGSLGKCFIDHLTRKFYPRWPT